MIYTAHNTLTGSTCIRLIPLFALLSTSLSTCANAFGLPYPVASPVLSNSQTVAINTAAPRMNKHSTASDVLSYLSKSDQLAPYAGPNGVAIITGGTSGIGIPTAEALALTGMKIVLCARDTSAASKIVKNMQAGLGIDKDMIRIQALDLSDLNSVQSAVEEILAIEGQVDLILNNAGVNSLPTRQTTAQNFETQFGVNHVGHFYLTRLLLPHIEKGGRVVTVSSTAHSTVRNLPMDDLNSEKLYSPWYAYGRSKLANILFAKGLQDKLNAERRDILSICLHPGIVKTNLWRYNDHSLISSISDSVMSKTVYQGAATSVYCSLGRGSRFKGGDYIVDYEEVLPSNLGRDKYLRKELWEETEKMICDAGFGLPDNLV